MEKKVVSLIKSATASRQAKGLTTWATRYNINLCTIKHIKKIFEKIFLHDILCQELGIKAKLSIIAHGMCQFTVLVDIACQ